MISSEAPRGPQQLDSSDGPNRPKPRLAIVSPFLDKSHGTERMVIEWIERLADEFEIHVYSQQIEDLNLSKIVWHRVPKIPGPHLFNFLYWFSANSRMRRRDSHKQKRSFDIVFSPGTNCLDADAVTVHIVFAEFFRRVGADLKFTRNSIRVWPRLLHRRIYYRVVMALEACVFRNAKTQLILTAPQSAAEISRFFGRTEKFPVVSPGLDHTVFNWEVRSRLREDARQSLSIPSDRFILLLVGNDWRKKGLGALLLVLDILSNLPIDLIVAGRDDPSSFLRVLRERSLESRVRFLPPRKDVEFFYAAADAYAGPSLEDTFALPASEAMACGLPVIVSGRAGAAGIITHGVDGLVINDPTDAQELAGLVRQLYEDRAFRERIGANGVITARKYTWERSTQDLADAFCDILRRKGERVPEIQIAAVSQ